jgi:uncharacterized protein YsxB (DUF464 family)
VLRFDAKGHSSRASPGYDIVCAAFSVLARTVYGALEALPGIEIRGEAPEPGDLSFEVVRPALSPERAAGIADCLVRGLGDLAREYPDSVRLSIERDLED